MGSCLSKSDDNRPQTDVGYNNGRQAIEMPMQFTQDVSVLRDRSSDAITDDVAQKGLSHHAIQFALSKGSLVKKSIYYNQLMHLYYK